MPAQLPNIATPAQCLEAYIGRKPVLQELHQRYANELDEKHSYNSMVEFLLAEDFDEEEQELIDDAKANCTAEVSELALDTLSSKKRRVTNITQLPFWETNTEANLKELEERVSSNILYGPTTIMNLRTDVAAKVKALRAREKGSDACLRMEKAAQLLFKCRVCSLRGAKIKSLSELRRSVACDGAIEEQTTPYDDFISRIMTETPRALRGNLEERKRCPREGTYWQASAKAINQSFVAYSNDVVVKFITFMWAYYLSDFVEDGANFVQLMYAIYDAMATQEVKDCFLAFIAEQKWIELSQIEDRDQWIQSITPEIRSLFLGTHAAFLHLIIQASTNFARREVPKAIVDLLNLGGQINKVLAAQLQLWSDYQGFPVHTLTLVEATRNLIPSNVPDFGKFRAKDYWDSDEELDWGMFQMDFVKFYRLAIRALHNNDWKEAVRCFRCMDRPKTTSVNLKNLQKIYELLRNDMSTQFCRIPGNANNIRNIRNRAGTAKHCYSELMAIGLKDLAPAVQKELKLCLG